MNHADALKALIQRNEERQHILSLVHSPELLNYWITAGHQCDILLFPHLRREE
jgi:hypothetical protein